MSIVANISPTSIHEIVADKSPPSIIAFLASDCWNWSLLPPTSHTVPLGHSSLDFFSAVLEAKMKTGGWHGQLHGDYV
jgi:hypothetical protein